MTSPLLQHRQGRVSKRTVAVVDPVTVGGPFGREISAMGHDPVGVLTQEFHTPYVAQSFQPQHFREIHRHGSLDDTIGFLRDQRVEAVIPGTQTALDWVDVFADELGLLGNPVASMAARTNKRVMKEYWKKRGVPCAAFHESGSLKDVLAWAEKQGYPVVLKPNASSGSSNVYVCTNEREIAKAFEVITHAPDMYHKRFTTVLAEEYLDGDEYFMNLLHDGSREPALVSVAHYEKIQRDGHASIYRNFKSLPLDGPMAREAFPYVRAVNDAIEVRYGINDTEFKATSKGLRAIEVNNRLPGACTPLMIQVCSGLNCFQEIAGIFLGEYQRPAEPYRFSKHYCVCCLINHRAGKVVGHRGDEDIKRLPSYYDGVRMVAEVGKYWPVTEDITTLWGLVLLVHEDRAQLDRDAEAVHGLTQLLVE